MIGSVFVFLVGATANVSTLIFAMTAFGICKGFYDSNIFASIYDVVEPQVRAAAAGIMNTVGWGGGALGPLIVGWFTEHGGGATKMENMSRAISFGGGIYILSALLLFRAIYLLRRRDKPAEV
jgi:MFS family permease